jgi:hypothetical protein
MVVAIRWWSAVDHNLDPTVPNQCFWILMKEKYEPNMDCMA